MTMATNAGERVTAREKIEAVLESIRPALRSDGGVVELFDFDEEDGIVQLRLMGACGSCPVSMLTLKQGIERRIIMAVPEVRGINAL
ncbi:MAG TPA: NifU family protein [Longimicrobiales bacterium]|nr:NifU family protein [Longimicrobiales bacterium]